MKNLRNLFIVAGFILANLTSIYANTTPQTLPFTQDWSATGTLLTTANDWSNVPGIVGYQGTDASSNTGMDPRSILVADTVPQVFVNATTANTSGGVGEFETEQTIAMQGSGTGDFPHITVYLNTTGQSKIRVQCNVRDIDGTTDNSIQSFVIQYRVGSTGNFITVPGSYIADATTGPSLATLVTPIDVTLPAAANNQPVVEVRFMTTNAVSTDEWVGVDDINITANSPKAYPTANVDFNGDGRTDFVNVRATNSPIADPNSLGRKILSNKQKREIGITRNGVPTQIYWYVNLNGIGTTSVLQWGLDTDFLTPADFDGDGKTDWAVWRPGAATQAAYYILQSSDFTFKEEKFGQFADDPTVVGDYDGDGKADVAVYRQNAISSQSYFFYRGSLNNPNANITFIPWGTGTDEGISGDFDGDGKNDFCIERNNAGANQFILLRSSDFGAEFIDWGLTSDTYAPGDYDGDGKDDFMMVRGGTNLSWYLYTRAAGGNANPTVWGLGVDEITPGDYDGDGRSDVAIWRFDTGNADNNFYHIRQSARITASGTEGSLSSFEWGTGFDIPAANWANH
jgi:hypothetical protein